MALAACERDVGQEVEHLARGRRWRAGRFEPVSPLGGRRDGRRGCVPVDAARAGRVVRAGVRQALGVAVGHEGLAGGHGRQPRVREGGEGGGGGAGGRPHQRGGTMGAQRTPQAGQLVHGRQGAAVTPRGLRHPGTAVVSQLTTWVRVRVRVKGQGQRSSDFYGTTFNNRD